jgi:hypothetical protein
MIECKVADDERSEARLPHSPDEREDTLQSLPDDPPPGGYRRFARSLEAGEIA